ncbi:hypothetical protein EB795_28650 [Pseudomonas mandelii]|nr:hypothetical protein [Pseudomonas mandelii]
MVHRFREQARSHRVGCVPTVSATAAYYGAAPRKSGTYQRTTDSRTVRAAGVQRTALSRLHPAFKMKGSHRLYISHIACRFGSRPFD